MSKHTPGPWDFIVIDEVTAVLPEWPDGEQPDVNDKCDIAHCYGPDQEANARLIAAAPDLLSALIAALEDLEEYRVDANCTPSSIEMVIAAIAKATGEAQ